MVSNMISNSLVCDILEYINKNINEKITIDDLTYEFNYNRYYLMKLFKKELDISIVNYINYKRIYNSLSSLRENKSILMIALNNGFYSQEYYAEIFKKVIGTNPITYKSFIKNIHLSKQKNEDILITNLINLEDIMNKVNNYIKRRKTDSKIKSIFKQI